MGQQRGQILCLMVTFLLPKILAQYKISSSQDFLGVPARVTNTPDLGPIMSLFKSVQ
jgi:hypothetical protein